MFQRCVNRGTSSRWRHAGTYRPDPYTQQHDVNRFNRLFTKTCGETHGLPPGVRCTGYPVSLTLLSILQPPTPTIFASLCQQRAAPAARGGQRYSLPLWLR